MLEMDLRQPGFTNSASGRFTKKKKKRKNPKFKETWDSQYIYQNELGKACFQPNITCEDFRYCGQYLECRSRSSRFAIDRQMS